eukprot:14999817-Alexandrium_andersonii.AAC.1
MGSSGFKLFQAVSCAPLPLQMGDRRPPARWRRRRFSGGRGGDVAPSERERRKLLETARNRWGPLEPLRTLR